MNLTFIHCICKFEKHKQSSPSENCNRTFHNKSIKKIVCCTICVHCSNLILLIQTVCCSICSSIPHGTFVCNRKCIDCGAKGLVDSIRQRNEWWQNHPMVLELVLGWQRKYSCGLISSNTVRGSVLGMKYMFLFSLKLSFEAFIVRYSLSYLTGACINTCRSLFVKCSLPFSSFIEKWVVTADCSRTFQYKILWESVHWFLSC